MELVNIPKIISTLCRYQVATPNVRHNYIYFLDFLFNFGNNQQTIKYNTNTTKYYSQVIIYDNKYCISNTVYSFDTYKKAIQYYLNIFKEQGYDTQIFLSNNILKVFFELLLIQSKSQQGIIIGKEYPHDLSLIQICEILTKDNMFIRQELDNIIYRFNDVKIFIETNLINNFGYKFTIVYDNNVVYEHIPIEYPTIRDNIFKDKSIIDLSSNSLLSRFKEDIKYIPQSQIVRNIQQQPIQPQTPLPNWMIENTSTSTKEVEKIQPAKLVIKTYYCYIPKIYKQDARYYINYNRIWVLPINCKIIHGDKKTKSESSSHIHFTWSIEPLSDKFTIINIKSNLTDNELIKWKDNNYYNNSHRIQLRENINDKVERNRGNQVNINFLTNLPIEIGRTNNFIVQGGISEREKYFLGEYVVGHRLKKDYQDKIESLFDKTIISHLYQTKVSDEIYKKIISFVDLYVTNNTKSFTIDLGKSNTNNMIYNNQYPISDIDINKRIVDIIGRKKRYDKILKHSIKDLIDVFINKEKIQKIITTNNALEFITELNIIEFLYLSNLYNILK